MTSEDIKHQLIIIINAPCSLLFRYPFHPIDVFDELDLVHIILYMNTSDLVHKKKSIYIVKRVKLFAKIIFWSVFRLFETSLENEYK